MSHSTYVRVELVHLSPGCCNLEFGLPRSLYDDCRNNGTAFHCPKCGCPRVFTESETKKLKKAIRILKGNVDNSERRRLEAEEQRNAARKSHKKMRDRVKNGVCPCCNRSFDNLLRHMRTKHPDYGNNQTLKQLRETYGLTQLDLANELGVSQAQVSCFECGRSVASWARDQIESWIDEQGRDTT